MLDKRFVHTSSRSEVVKKTPKYLMISTLEGQIVNDGSDFSENDLVLEYFDSGDIRVLKDGINIINTLNQLINFYDYQIIFYSKETKDAQSKAQALLQSACIESRLNFPKISAMAIYDKSLSGVASDNAIKTENKKNGICIALWGADDQAGKSSIRRALEQALGIADKDRKTHIVIDNDSVSVDLSLQEGYQGFLITPQMSLDTALTRVLSQHTANLLEPIPEVKEVLPSTKKNQPAEKTAKKLSPGMQKVIDDLKKHIAELEKHGEDLKELSRKKDTEIYNMTSKEYIKGDLIIQIAETLNNDLSCFTKSINRRSFKEFSKKCTDTLDFHKKILQTHRDEWVPYAVIAANILFALTGIGALILAGNAIFVSTTREGLTLNSSFFGMRTATEKMRLGIKSDLEEIASEQGKFLR